MAKKWKRRTDNKMRYTGEIDWHRGLIRVNKKRAKSKRVAKRYGYDVRTGILNTIVHEEMHRQHPKMSEKIVKKKTRKKVRKMSRKQKQKHYSRYR